MRTSFNQLMLGQLTYSSLNKGLLIEYHCENLLVGKYILMCSNDQI